MQLISNDIRAKIQAKQYKNYGFLSYARKTFCDLLMLL